MTKKKILKEFTLTEISAVDNPAQPTAKATIMKRHEVKFNEVIHKYICDAADGKARSFSQIVNEKEASQKIWQVRDKLWPLFDAINDSVSSIITDTNLSESGKKERIDQSLSEFSTKFVDEFPEIQDELNKFIKSAGYSGLKQPRENTMTEEEIAKKVADEVAKATEELTKQATELQLLADMNDADKEVYKAMTDEEKAEWAKLTPEERKKKKEDVAKRNETVEFEGKTVSKSVVGDETFEVIKSLAKKFEENEARVAKAEADAEMATLEKRASEEFKNIAGTPTEIAAVLKGLKSLPEEVATRIEGYMVAVNKSAAADFDVKGTKAVAKSADAFNAKVEEIAKRDGVKKSQAFLIAAKEHPELTQKD